MSTDTLIQKWLAGQITEGRAASMSVTGNSLYSYATKIAVLEGDLLRIITDDFSRTTKKQKTKLAWLARQNGNKILFTNHLTN